MNKILILSLTAIAFLFSACDEADTTSYREEVVVDGFLYIGEPLSIKLSHTVAIDQAYYPDQVIVEGADVSISVDGNTYTLTEAVSGIPGKYAAPADSHLVQTGKTYDLFVAYNSDTITATTTATADLNLLETSINNYSEINPDSVEYGGDPLFMRWNNDPMNFGYALLIECMDTTKYGDDCEFGDDNGPGDYVTGWTLQDVDHLSLPWITLCYKGLHRIRIYSCETAWWNYFSTTLLGQIDNHPVSNLSAGQGLFCAVGCDTVNFVVKDDIED